MKPFLPIDTFANPPEVYTGPRGNLYERIRLILRSVGLLRVVRNVIGLRVIMSARYFFTYSPTTPTDAHFRYEVYPYPVVTHTVDDHAMDTSDGVNVIGYLNANKGLGQSARNLIDSLSSASMPVSAWTLDERDQTRHAAVNHAVPIIPKYKISILNVNADQTYIVEDLLGTGFYLSQYCISYWYWETAAFPERWKSAFDRYDEIWVATEFVQRAIQTHTQKPVYRVPLPMNIQRPANHALPTLNLPEGQFMVLFIFDAISIVERKNPWAVIDAYERAFNAGERQSRVKLVIKANNLDKLPAVGARLRAEISRVNGILISESVDRAYIDALMGRCDVYISLHRSEGLGLTLAEAMALGKPVIGTAYSGNMDFMNEDNSYLVPYRLIDIDEANGFYDAGGVWADADIDAAALVLRDAYLHPEVAAEKGHRAAQFIRDHYNAHIIGSHIAARLRVIADRL